MGRRAALQRGAAGWLVALLMAGTASATTYTVTTSADAGAGSLRQAIADANGNAGPDTIVFDAALNGQTITLGSYLGVNSDVTITGPGANLLTVSGGSFDFASGTSSLSGLTIRGAGGLGGIFNAGTLTVTNARISQNSTNEVGGGIYNSGTLTLTNSTVSDNRADRDSFISIGGGIANDGMMTLTNTTVSGNFAWRGGGIYNRAGTMTLIRSAVSGNSTFGEAGGIFTFGMLTLRNSVVSGNQANLVGGISQGSAGTLILTNSTVAGNQSIGVRNYGTATLTNSTISGGISLEAGTLTAVSSIISGIGGNFAPGSTNNLIEDAAGAGGLINGVAGNIVGIDPLLGPLANNGGPTQTRALAANSPAIGQGVNPNNLTTDQRGGPFARGNPPDIGAFQRQTVNLVVDTIADVEDGDYSAGNLSLREAISAAAPNPGSDTVSFAAALNGQTITLAGAELVVNGDLTITGPGASLLTVSGNNLSRVFKFVAGTSSLSGLTVTGGRNLTTDFGFAGGIRNQGTLTLTNMRISGNTAGFGGGLGSSHNSVTVITNSTISGNAANFQAGMSLDGTVTVTNSTISGNTADTGAGGGFGNYGDLTLRYSTVVGNTSVWGGSGIHMHSGTVSIVSTIISGNTASGAPFDVEGLFAAGSTHNLIQDAGHAGGLTNGAGNNIVGVNPLLGPLADNDGPTQTAALLTGSPAINAGVCIAGVTTDQRGVARPQGAACDIGAFESLLTPTTTTLTSAPNPSLSGQSVTFTATVAVVPPGVGTPVGAVDFKDGVTTIGSGTLNAGGVATFSTSALSAGPRSIRATYNGAGGFDGSSSPDLTQTVNPADTTTTLNSSSNPSVSGQPLTFTAIVAAVAPGTGTPTGTVDFKDGATTIGSGTLNAQGMATFSTSGLSPGPHSITATYTGAAGFNASSSTVLTQTVNAANTTTTLTSSANPSLIGQSVTFTAAVAVVPPGAGTRTGTVDFKDGATTIGSGTLNAGGVATFSTSALSAGPHSLTATYNGAAGFDVSSSTVLTQTVNPRNTTTTLTSAPNPSLIGQSVTFTATVAVVAPGAGTPNGTVDFKDGATTIGSGTLNAGGVATFSTSALSAGSHSITATYNGAAGFNASSSAVLTQTVNQPIAANTTTTLTSSPNPSLIGQSVTFTATVAVVAPGTGTPTGMVTFSEGAGTLGAGTLNAGVATLAVGNLSAAVHAITATYNGDATFNASASPALNQTINQPPTPTDSDGDGVADANDGCPNDSAKSAPGVCGCGKPETDANSNGVPDCNDPTIGPCPANMTVDATSAAGAAVDFALPAGSSPLGATTVAATPPPGSTLPVGATTVTVTATDINGVKASCTFTVTVNPPAAGPGEQPGQQPGAQPGEQPAEQPGAQPGETPGQQADEPPPPVTIGPGAACAPVGFSALLITSCATLILHRRKARPAARRR